MLAISAFTQLSRLSVWYKIAGISNFVTLIGLWKCWGGSCILIACACVCMRMYLQSLYSKWHTLPLQMFLLCVRQSSLGYNICNSWVLTSIWHTVLLICCLPLLQCTVCGVSAPSSYVRNACRSVCVCMREHAREGKRHRHTCSECPLCVCVHIHTLTLACFHIQMGRTLSSCQ